VVENLKLLRTKMASSLVKASVSSLHTTTPQFSSVFQAAGSSQNRAALAHSGGRGGARKRRNGQQQQLQQVVVSSTLSGFQSFAGMRKATTAIDGLTCKQGKDFHSVVASAVDIKRRSSSSSASAASKGVVTAMFERFTEKAIKVIMLAQEEARRLGHNFVGTEQILLGLIGEGTGIAAKVLKSMGVNLKEARVEVEKIIGRGSGFVAVEIPFTPRAKRVLELSLEEARQLGMVSGSIVLYLCMFSRGEVLLG
jgi:ATP-dependent Clp protease ATP-binding subunit ClpC